MNVFMHIIHSNSYIHIYIYVYVYTCIYTTYGGFLKWEYLKSDHVSIETHGDLGIPHQKKKNWPTSSSASASLRSAVRPLTSMEKIIYKGCSIAMKHYRSVAQNVVMFMRNKNMINLWIKWSKIKMFIWDILYLE